MNKEATWDPPFSPISLQFFLWKGSNTCFPFHFHNHAHHITLPYCTRFPNGAPWLGFSLSPTAPLVPDLLCSNTAVFPTTLHVWSKYLHLACRVSKFSAPNSPGPVLSSFLSPREIKLHSWRQDHSWCVWESRVCGGVRKHSRFHEKGKPLNTSPQFFISRRVPLRTKVHSLGVFVQDQITIDWVPQTTNIYFSRF